MGTFETTFVSQIEETIWSLELIKLISIVKHKRFQKGQKSLRLNQAMIHTFDETLYNLTYKFRNQIRK